MALVIRWEFVKSRIGAQLLFPEGTSEELVETVDSLLSQAHYGGHIVLAGHHVCIKKNTIFIRRWQHLSWAHVCDGVEHAITTKFPESTFENSKASPAPNF